MQQILISCDCAKPLSVLHWFSVISWHRPWWQQLMTNLQTYIWVHPNCEGEKLCEISLLICGNIWLVPTCINQYKRVLLIFLAELIV